MGQLSPPQLAMLQRLQRGETQAQLSPSQISMLRRLRDLHLVSQHPLMGHWRVTDLGALKANPHAS